MMTSPSSIEYRLRRTHSINGQYHAGQIKDTWLCILFGCGRLLVVATPVVVMLGRQYFERVAFVPVNEKSRFGDRRC
jgi:hypothetical protein